MAVEYPRFMINRHAVILIPQQPALDWLIEIDPTAKGQLTLEAIQDEPDIFLIKEADEGEAEALRWVEKNWRIFFDHFLEGWVTDESMFPKNLSLKMFKQWFAVRYHSMIWDLEKAPLLVTDEEDDSGEGGFLH